MKVCVVSDNRIVVERFIQSVASQYSQYEFQFCSSSFTQGVMADLDVDVKPINFKKVSEEFLSQYEVFLSLHCKQIFPAYMVRNYRCINVHPGLNPYNRGWYPHVFSIVNQLPTGVTVHEMDEDIDHGSIIFQKQVMVLSADTSMDLYNRIIDAEMELLSEHLSEIVEGRYETVCPEAGNVNYKRDFERLCVIDLNKTTTYREVINHLRALTHGDYANAYFYDEYGEKVFLQLRLQKYSKCDRVFRNRGNFSSQIYRYTFTCLFKSFAAQRVAA